MNALLASCTVPVIAPVAPPWANAWATTATTAIKLIQINLSLESNMIPPCARNGICLRADVPYKGRTTAHGRQTRLSAGTGRCLTNIRTRLLGLGRCHGVHFPGAKMIVRGVDEAY